jgi:hypothetical protein
MPEADASAEVGSLLFAKSLMPDEDLSMLFGFFVSVLITVLVLEK